MGCADSKEEPPPPQEPKIKKKEQQTKRYRGVRADDEEEIDLSLTREGELRQIESIRQVQSARSHILPKADEGLNNYRNLVSGLGVDPDADSEVGDINVLQHSSSTHSIRSAIRSPQSQSLSGSVTNQSLPGMLGYAPPLDSPIGRPGLRAAPQAVWDPADPHTDSHENALRNSGGGPPASANRQVTLAFHGEGGSGDTLRPQISGGSASSGYSVGHNKIQPPPEDSAAGDTIHALIGTEVVSGEYGDSREATPRARHALFGDLTSGGSNPDLSQAGANDSMASIFPANSGRPMGADSCCGFGGVTSGRQQSSRRVRFGSLPVSPQRTQQHAPLE